MDIMFMISRKEYEEIVGVISKYCCPCDYRHEHCAEVECDVQMICEILWEHLERNSIESDEGKAVMECTREESGIDWNDELPFRK